MKQKAPISVEAPTGAEIRTAEAVRTFQFDQRTFSVRSQGDSTDEVPDVPERLQTIWKAPERTPAVSLCPVQ